MLSLSSVGSRRERIGQIGEKAGNFLIDKIACHNAPGQYRKISHAVNQDSQRNGVLGYRNIIVADNRTVSAVPGIDSTLKITSYTRYDAVCIL
jgi:hypothetical protein